MLVRPFRGLRPRADLASRIPSYPYDVVDSEEARQLAKDDPYTFLHVVKPEIDLAADIDVHDKRVYEQARENFQHMRQEGWLLQDERPSFYLYRLTMQGRTQIGVLGAASVQDYNEGRIRKHEHTRPDKEQDRVNLNDAIGANPGPVILTYRSHPQLDALIADLAKRPPDTCFTAADGIEHALWTVEDAAVCGKIEAMFGELPCTYVADGHHRTAAAARVSQLRAARLPNNTDNEPCHFFMAAHFPAEQLHILDYNRLVADLNGLSDADFIDKLRQAGFALTEDHHAQRPTHRGTFGMYLAGRWYLLTANDEMLNTGDVVERMDVSILSRYLLEPLLGIGDARHDKRIEFVGGIRGMQELERCADSGKHAVAFALHPTSLEDVLQVADEGKVMPPKSTWFEPKLRSGMVVQLLDGDKL